MGFKDIFVPKKKSSTRSNKVLDPCAFEAEETEEKEEEKTEEKTEEEEEKDEEAESIRTIDDANVSVRKKRMQIKVKEVVSKIREKQERSPKAEEVFATERLGASKRVKTLGRPRKELEFASAAFQAEEGGKEQETGLASRNVRELMLALDRADEEEDGEQSFGRFRDVERALRDVRAREDAREREGVFVDVLVRCWNLAVMRDGAKKRWLGGVAQKIGIDASDDVEAKVVSVNVRERVLELLKEVGKFDDCVEDLSGKLAETCYERARFSVAEKYFAMALERTIYAENCTTATAADDKIVKEDDEEKYLRDFKIAALRGANFIRLNNLSSASSMFTKCAEQTFAIDIRAEESKKGKMFSILFDTLDALAKDVEGLAKDEGDAKKMMEVIKVSIENLIDVAEPNESFSSATKHEMRARAGKICVFLGNTVAAAKHLSVLASSSNDDGDDDKIKTVEDAQTLISSAQAAILSGNKELAEKCALRVLDDENDALFKTTRTLRSFASAAFILALATNNINDAVEKIEKRLHEIQMAKDDESKLALIAAAFWATFCTITTTTIKIDDDDNIDDDGDYDAFDLDNEGIASKYAERLLAPSSLITKTLTSSETSKESSPLLARARALAWNRAVALEFAAEQKQNPMLAKIAHDAFGIVIAIDKVCDQADLVPDKDTLEFQSFQNDEADALKAKTFCALSSSAEDSIKLASLSLQALEAHESREMRLVSASTALLRLKLCSAELEKLREVKDAMVPPIGGGENTKIQIIARVKNAFHMVCRVGDPSAIVFAASELEALRDSEIIADALRTAWESLIAFEKKNTQQQKKNTQQQKKNAEEEEKKLKNEAIIFRAYLMRALNSLTTTTTTITTATTADTATSITKFLERLTTDICKWVARTAKYPALLTIFPESLTIIDITYDLADICLERRASFAQTSSTMVDCARRLFFTAAQLIDRIGSLKEYDEGMSRDAKARGNTMILTCFQIGIATMLDSISLDENSLSKAVKACAKYDEHIEKNNNNNNNNARNIQVHKDNLVAYEFAILNLQKKIKCGSETLKFEEAKEFCDTKGVFASPRSLLRLTEDYPENTRAVSVINNFVIERVLATKDITTLDNVTLATAFRKLLATEENDDVAFDTFKRLTELDVEGVVPVNEAEYLVSLAFNRATRLERSDSPESALKWIVLLNSGVLLNAHSFLSKSLRHAFVDSFALKVLEAEADLRGDLGVA